MPGPRTIVFISDGFNRIPGRELYSVLRDGYGVRDRSIQFSSQDTQPQMEAILKLSTRYDIKFYTLDSRGLYSNASISGGGFSATASLPQPEAVDSQARSVAHENTDALAQLAYETGGLFFENSNDLLKGLRQAFADGQDYYVLSYVPENKTADGKYRKILVATNNAKWRVVAKAGYWAAEN
jgi:VWFA-related protein